MTAFDKAWGVVKDDRECRRCGQDLENPFQQCPNCTAMDQDEPPVENDQHGGVGPTPYNHLDRREDGLYIGGNKVLKGWESYSGWYWFATELGDQDARGQGADHFGYVQGMEPEFGYFSIREMQPLIDQGRIWELPQDALSYSGRPCVCDLCYSHEY